jgi:type IV pilus assembly protein PilA
VLVIIGVLLAIAVPAYLGFTTRSEQATAKANLREAVPTAEAYYVDCHGYLDSPAGTPCGDGKYHTFQRASKGAADGSSPANALGFLTYDSGLSPDVTVNSSSDTAYCLQAQHGGSGTYWFAGPGGSVTATKPAGCV